MTTDMGRKATAILKAGHEAQTDLALRIKTLRKTETDLHTVATKMEAAMAAQREAHKKAKAEEEKSKAAQLKAAKEAGEI